MLDLFERKRLEDVVGVHGAEMSGKS
jgi:hypothetical protein